MPASLTNSPAYFNRTKIIGLPNKYAVRRYAHTSGRIP